MANERLGIVEERMADRAKWGHKLYRPPVITTARSHRITVDLRSGQKSIEALGSSPVVLPKAVSLPRVEHICIPGPMRQRNSGNWRRLTDDRVQDQIKIILRVTAAAFGVGVAALISPSRTRRLAYPRFAAVHFLRKVLRISLPSVGRVLQRDHTTCLAAMHRAAELRRLDPNFRMRCVAIVRALRAARRHAGAQQ